MTNGFDVVNGGVRDHYNEEPTRHRAIAIKSILGPVARIWTAKELF